MANNSSGPIALYEHLDEIESLAARFGDCSLQLVTAEKRENGLEQAIHLLHTLEASAAALKGRGTV